MEKEVVTKSVERTDISASSSDAAKETEKGPTKSPKKKPSKSLKKEPLETPEKESSKSPEKKPSETPEKESSKSPEKEPIKRDRQTRSMTKQASKVDTEEEKEEEEEEDDNVSDDSDILDSVDEIRTELPKHRKKTGGLGKGIKRKRGPVYLPRANNSTAFEASWNETDKKRLLIALQRFGILEIDKLIKSVPGKSEEDIRKFISIKWRSARTELRTHLREFRKSRGDNTSYLGPVDNWLEVLANFYPNYDHYKTNPIAHAVLLIWKYEKHPDPSECGGVDFKALYEYMYYMLCGYPPKHLNPPTAAYLAESLKNFAGQIRSGDWSEIIEHMKSPLKIKPPNRSPVTEDDVIAAFSYSKEKCIEELAKLSGYNPFSIPINLLRKIYIPADK